MGGKSLHRQFNGKAPAPPRDVVEFIQRLSMARGLDEIMAVVRSGARHLTGADGVTFVLRDGDFCHYADEDAISPLWKGQRFPMERCISGWAMLNRQAAVIPDIFADSRIPHDAYRLTFVKSLVMVPVRQEDPVAAIGAYWATKRTPSKVEVDVLMTIANSAAVAMTNAALDASLLAAKEEAERQAAAARREARAKLLFLANVSHEFRTPLNAILGFSQIMQMRRIDPSSHQYDEYLDHVRGSAGHLLDLVTDLLDMARIEEGRFPLTVGPLDLAQVVDEAVGLLQVQADEGGVTLHRAPGAVTTVRGDRRATKQVVINLLSNAVKFTMRSGRVDVGLAETGTGCCVTIRDTGIGMSSADLARIGEPFVQMAREKNQFHRGTGLGLAIATALARLQGGSVDIDSREGHGTTVRLHLPAWREEVPVPAE